MKIFLRSPVGIAVAITVVLWASAFAGIRAALVGYSPTHLAFLRFLVASIALGLYALVARKPLPRLRDVPGFLVLGGIGISLYNVALNAGEQQVSAGSASLLVNTAPIWTALLAGLALQERLPRWGWVGIGVSFAGALVIAASEGSGLQMNGGAFLILLAALAQSAYFVLQKPYLSRYHPIEVTTYAIWAGTVWLLPFAFGLYAQIQRAPLEATVAVIYLGIFPAAIAYIAWAYVLAKFPAGRAASFLYAVPVVAFIIAWFWLGEQPQPLTLVGGALALIGVVIVNTKGRSK